MADAATAANKSPVAATDSIALRPTGPLVNPGASTFMDWKTYIQKTKNKLPSLLLDEAISHAHIGHALDIGAGNLVDSKKLIEKGFKVVVVDPNVETLQSNEIEILSKRIEDFKFPSKKFTLINAQYSLPFTEKIATTMQNIYNSLEDGGVFSGQFFGKEDEWNNRDGITTHAREEVESFFDQWQIIKFEEEKRIRGTALHGDKLWHVFHVIAQKVQQN